MSWITACANVYGNSKCTPSEFSALFLPPLDELQYKDDHDQSSNIRFNVVPSRVRVWRLNPAEGCRVRFGCR